MRNIFPAVLCLCCFVSSAQTKTGNLLTENLTNPTGIDILTPRFSWQLISDQKNILQAAYEIKVMQGNAVMWSSGKTSSDQSVHVQYAGKSLQSGKKYSWTVRVWDNAGDVSGWSQPAYFQMALLNKSDWTAKWISPGFIEDSVNRPAVLFRKTFTTKKKIISAIAYITAHGMYEWCVNGRRVGDAYLSPGWTSYNKRLQYQVYDVTELLSNGSNAMGITVGNGWYRGYLAWDGNKNSYGKDASVIVQINITYSDGKTESVISDESWKSSTGAIRYDEIYHGETVDARLEKTGWTTARYDDAGWDGVQEGNYSKEVLLASYNEPIRKHETFHAVKFITTPKGERVIDFGQNLVGWVMVKATGNAGDSIIIHHAEVLDKDGNFYTENLRAAKATAVYVLSGKGEEFFEPHFTFFGFRYIRVDKFPGEINPDNFTAVALYSDFKPTGEFTCSDPLINQLQHNIQWGQRGNFLDVPTDCPQRDERLGWTGDAQAFSRTAAFNFGVNNFFAKWLRDVAADQLPDGKIPFVIPNVLGPDAGGATGWADVATIIPWNMYLAYGDKRLLENQYESMKAWVKYMQDRSTNYLWNTGYHFGDWLFYRPFDDNDGRSAVTDKYFIAQCFFANSIQLVINAATVLGKKDDVEKYKDLLQKVKDAFVKEYVTANGKLVSGTQTAYVLALNFDMLPENFRKQTAELLVKNIQSYGNHLTTGFLGTPYLCHVLTRFGYTDVAYTLLMQKTYPSWLYPVTMGATTIWERWDGEKPDGSFETPGMNSFNHYAYGAIGDWMYKVIAGLNTYDDGPGFKHIRIQPHVGGGLTSASTSLKTYYGKLSCNWKIENGKIIIDIEIPANTTAEIFLPGAGTSQTTGSGTYHFEVNK